MPVVAVNGVCGAGTRCRKSKAEAELAVAVIDCLCLDNEPNESQRAIIESETVKTESASRPGPTLPPEVLSLIAEWLAFSNAKASLLELGLASKATFAIAEPCLLRKMDFSLTAMSPEAVEVFVREVVHGDSGRKRPAALVHVREISVPAARSVDRKKTLVSILKACLPHVKRVSLDLESPSEATNYWSALSSFASSKLERLDLDISGSAMTLFRASGSAAHAAAKLPDSVQTVRIFLSWDARANAAPLFNMLEKRAPHVKHLYLLFADPARLGLSKFPTITSKLRSACVHWRELAFLSTLANLELKKLIVFDLDGAPSDGRLFELISKWTTLERLTLFGLKTSTLAYLPLLPANLKTLIIMDPVPSSPDSFSELALKQAFNKRPNLSTVLEVGARIQGLPYPWAKVEHEGEMEVLKRLPTVKWVWK